MRVGPQLAAIRFSKRGKDKLLGLTNDALLLLADKAIPSRLESNIQSCFHSHSQSLSLHLFSFSFSLPFSFAFQAGHLVAPDSIINCALHSIYLSCFFSGNTSVCVWVCKTLICYTLRMRVFFNLKSKSTTRTGTSTTNSFTSVSTFEMVRYGSIIYFAYFLDSNDTWFPFSAISNSFLMPFERAMRVEVVQRVCIVKYFKCS